MEAASCGDAYPELQHNLYQFMGLPAFTTQLLDESFHQIKVMAREKMRALGIRLL